MTTTTSWRLLLLTAIAPMTWGTTYVVSTEWLPPERPLLAATVRALPAGLLLVAVGRQLPRGDWWWRAAVLGALNIGAFFALLFVAADRLPGGVAATLGAVQPLVVVGLSAALLSERVTVRSILAGVVGVLGVALLVLRGSAGLDTVGVLAGLAGAVSMALGVVLSKRWGRPESVSVISYSGWLLAAGGLWLFPLTMSFEAPPVTLTATHVGGFAYLAIINTAVAYCLWLRGIQLLPARNVAYLGLLSPIVATVVGALALGETLTALQSLGLALALGSMVGGQTTPRRLRPVPGSGLTPNAASPVSARQAA
jgi:probable blue pigment (indigoidine) exporter